MAGTFSGYTTTTYTLTANPTTVTSSGTIEVNSAFPNVPGILGTSGVAWTLTNLGTVESIGSQGIGVGLQSGGFVTNGASGSAGGYINATGAGIAIGGSAGDTGTVVNYGTVRAVGTGTYGVGIVFGAIPGTVINSGTILAGDSAGKAAGIYLNGGGVLVNNASGIINALYGLYDAGIYSKGTAAVSLTNAGTIVGNGTKAAGVIIGSGSINNTGLVSGGNSGVQIGNSGAGVGTVVNSGTISATNSGTNGGDAVKLQAGGSVTNSGTGLITGPNHGVDVYGGAGTLTNSGTIEGTGSLGTGVSLASGGLIMNGMSGGTAGLISGSYHGVYIGGGAGTVVNFGTIEAFGYASVRLGGTGTVTNYGSILALGSAHAGVAFHNTVGAVSNFGLIQGSTYGSGVRLHDGGSVTNGSTSNTTATISGGSNGINVSGAPGTVSNFGTIAGAGTAGIGIALGAGGIAINGTTGSTTALISGSRNGIAIGGSAGTGGSVFNYGTITNAGTGTVGAAVYFGQGGNLANQSTGMISAYRAVISVAGGPATMVNLGTLQTTGTAVAAVIVKSGGTLSNHGQITSAAGAVAFSNAAGTVDNFGNITSTLPLSATAGAGVYLGNGGQIVNEVGATISAVRAAVSLARLGTATAGATVTNMGTLIGSAGVVIGTTASTGNNTIVNFGTIIGTSGTAIRFGAGSDLLAFENASNLSLQGVVANLLPGDRFDLAFQAFDPSGTATVVSNGTVSQQLDIVENGTTFTIALDPNQNFSSDTFQLGTDSASGTLVTEQPVCFCRGTMILTDRGEVAVEALAVGDRVVTLAGAAKPIRWIGMGRDLVTRANKLARPVVVRAGALDDDVPRRDLYLTHGHALYFDGVLIPVENLVNHRSILWDETARVVEYYHIELDDHDVLLAEGAPAETYYDAGNRALFHNTREGSQAGADKPTVAPVLNGGDVVERVWAALYERAGGQILDDTTDDPDLHLVVDGARLDAASVTDCTYTFAVDQPPAGMLRLSSRVGVPSLLGLTRHDHRRLGVAVRCIELRQAGVATGFEYTAPLFAEGGCHPAETGYSWTDGEFELPARLFAHLTGAFTLTVHTERPGMRYPLPAEVAIAKAA